MTTAAARTTLTERLRALELGHAETRTLLQEIHRAVVPEGGKPLVERVGIVESQVTTLQKQLPTWKQRAIQTAASTAIAAIAGYFGVHLGPQGGQL